MSLYSLFEGLGDKLRLLAWIRTNQNLALLRRRMHQEIPAPYLRGFYRAWVFEHARARLRLGRVSPSAPAPLTIKISPTQKCNLRCKGCFASNYTARSVMTLPVMERVIRQGQEAGVQTVGVIGGEPLLVDGIWDLFREFPNVGFYLVTNGTLLDDEVAAELATLPNVIPIFSVEGPRQTNDFLRGDGVYDQVIASMGRLREHRVVFGFSTTVHRENMDEVVSSEFVDTMIGHGAYFGGFLPYVPVGASPRYGVVNSVEEVRAYYRRLDEVTAGRPIGILKEGYTDGSFLNQGCRAASTLHVTADGRIEPCNGIQFANVDVLSGSIGEALSSPFFQNIRDLHPHDGRRCLVNTEPTRILRIVERHRPEETHPGALEHLREYAARFEERRSGGEAVGDAESAAPACR